MQELVESQKMNSQYVAAAMGAAQQQAASEYERLHAESLAAQQQTEAARSYWRHRAGAAADGGCPLLLAPSCREGHRTLPRGRRGARGGALVS